MLLVTLMKKLLQIVAVAVVALLAVQPALAGLPCLAGSAAGTGCAADCGMAMSQMPAAQSAASPMGADCGMMPQLSRDGCAQDCCGDRVSQGIAQPASGEKWDAGGTMDFVPAAQGPAVATPLSTAVRYAEFVSTAPPRTILFQVFRI